MGSENRKCAFLESVEKEKTRAGEEKDISRGGEGRKRRDSKVGKGMQQSHR